MTTATQDAMRRYDLDRQRERMQLLHKEFREKYAPNDPHERDRFEVDLAMLLREISIDVLKPFQDAAADRIAKTPIPPIFLKNTDT